MVFGLAAEVVRRNPAFWTFNSLWELDGVRTAGLGALERQGTGGGIARISYFRHKLLRLSWKKTSYCAKIKDRGSPGFFAHQRPSHIFIITDNRELTSSILDTGHYNFSRRHPINAKGFSMPAQAISGKSLKRVLRLVKATEPYMLTSSPFDITPLQASTANQ